MFDYKNKPRSEWENLIDEWIFSERDRQILKARLLDGKLFKEIADEFHLTERHVKSIVYKLQDKLFKHTK